MNNTSQNTPQTVADLKPAHYNPRRISHQAADGLGYSMETFGDLSGIVYNVRTGQLVSGHQRVAQLPPQAILGPMVAMPDKHGTVGVSVIEHDGARWPVRLVDWELPKEKAANLAANNAALQGMFTEAVGPMLAELTTELPELSQGLRLAEIHPGVMLGPIGDGNVVENGDNEWQGMPESQNENLEGRKLIVHFYSQEAFDEFARRIEQRLTPRTKSIWFPKEPDDNWQSRQVVDAEGGQE